MPRIEKNTLNWKFSYLLWNEKNFKVKNLLGLEKLTLNWKFYFKVKNLLWIEKFTLNWKNCFELKKLLWIKKFTLNWIIHNERKDQSVYAGWLWKILTVADLYYTTSSDTDSVAYLPTGICLNFHLKNLFISKNYFIGIVRTILYLGTVLLKLLTIKKIMLREKSTIT